MYSSEVNGQDRKEKGDVVGSVVLSHSSSIFSVMSGYPRHPQALSCPSEGQKGRFLGTSYGGGGGYGRQEYVANVHFVKTEFRISFLQMFAFWKKRNNFTVFIIII